jgi:protein-export membrane protein SecD
MIAYGIQPIVTRRGAGPEAIWRTYVVKSRAEVTGDSIVTANVGFDQQTGTPEVNLKLDRNGADRFESMSGENIGRKMAIMLDDEVMSDPIFNDRIPGGNVRITMGQTPGQSVREAANDLVKVLKSGSLPARLVKEFEIRVGADLGKDAVESGFWAFVFGLGAVVLFTGVYYRIAGIIAVFALVLNVLLILAAMAFFQATLTLPGIAGIVLTLGMAVDANVIIYERIRELLRDGYTARAAIEAGYDRAFTTILDSQLTTAIAGIVLWQYGSGPIRGFAITLLIGITTSIFTAVFCTRLFFDFQANRRGFDRVSSDRADAPGTVAMKFFEIIPPGTKFPFVRSAQVLHHRLDPAAARLDRRRWPSTRHPRLGAQLRHRLRGRLGGPPGWLDKEVPIEDIRAALEAPATRASPPSPSRTPRTRSWSTSRTSPASTTPRPSLQGRRRGEYSNAKLKRSASYTSGASKIFMQVRAQPTYSELEALLTKAGCEGKVDKGTGKLGEFPVELALIGIGAKIQDDLDAAFGAGTVA